MPRSMCSLMPKPKLPESEKLRRISSYSLTFRPASCARERVRGAEQRVSPWCGAAGQLIWGGLRVEGQGHSGEMPLAGLPSRPPPVAAAEQAHEERSRSQHCVFCCCCCSPRRQLPAPRRSKLPKPAQFRRCPLGPPAAWLQAYPRPPRARPMHAAQHARADLQRCTAHTPPSRLLPSCCASCRQCCQPDSARAAAAHGCCGSLLSRTPFNASPARKCRHDCTAATMPLLLQSSSWRRCRLLQQLTPLLIHHLTASLGPCRCPSKPPPTPRHNKQPSARSATHQQLHRLLAAHGHVGRDLLVTADGPLAHGVARLAKHRLLASQLLQHVRQGEGGVGASSAG